MVAGNVENFGARSNERFDVIDHFLTGARPMPALIATPSIDEITDEVNLLGSIGSQEIEALLGLGMFGTEMHVAYQKRADRRRGSEFRHIVLTFAKSWTSD